ncbi:DUF4395 family protein [Sulfurimonas sp.]
MSHTCPLNFVPIDSNTSRLSSLIVAILVITYVITLNEYILYFLFFDFTFKLFIKKDSSIVFMIALYMKELLNIGEKLTDGGAKRLAGMFGLFFVLLLLITHFLNFFVASIVVAGIFVTCSLLDVILNYCLGCKIYFLIKKVHPNFMNAN